MAPALAETAPVAPHTLSKKADTSGENVDRAIFPDGIKTSGQHPPIYSQLQPYSAFPKEITGPTVWRASDYLNNRERWTHDLSDSEIAELSATADDFIASSTPLTGISQSNFPLPTLGPFLRTLRNELLNGKGFILIKNFPADRWSLQKSATAYMGLGTYLGYFVSQNGRGHVLGHVKDLGEDATQTDKVRIYRTNARQFFHTDDSDIVGLLCVAKALEGGESDIVSSHLIWNTLQAEHPDVAELLTQPIWYFDRKGETSQGQEDWVRNPIFYLEPPSDGQASRVYCKFDPYFLTSLKRYSSIGLVPALSPEQQRAITIVEETCLRLSLHMILDVGDIQFLHNSQILHARTAYKDYVADHPDHPEWRDKKRRHLMRLWLSTPEDEGGWRLPFHDSSHKKRGGIQVNETAPVCPLDAE